MPQFSLRPRFRRQLAVALRYDEAREPAPRVVARGAGVVARRIVELARAHGIPIRDDPDLVESLSQLELGDIIPPELYPAVAEVLAYIYRMNGKYLRLDRNR
ncbi:MAG: EscU/YscU/HrcU family type III secretion system export apparatus switch protein [Planctomycetota bacterium]